MILDGLLKIQRNLIISPEGDYRFEIFFSYFSKYFRFIGMIREN